MTASRTAITTRAFTSTATRNKFLGNSICTTSGGESLYNHGSTRCWSGFGNGSCTIRNNDNWKASSAFRTIISKNNIAAFTTTTTSRGTFSVGGKKGRGKLSASSHDIEEESANGTSNNTIDFFNNHELSFRTTSSEMNDYFPNNETESGADPYLDGIYPSNSTAPSLSDDMCSVEEDGSVTCPNGAESVVNYDGSTATTTPTTASLSKSILAIEASNIHIEPTSETKEQDADDTSVQYPFVKMFRGCASYISNHRGEVTVMHLPGEFIDSPGFAELVDDIALTWILGIKIVIVVGCRVQIDTKLEQLDKHIERHNLIRVTDEETLRIVKEEAGYTRFEVERQLARAFRVYAGPTENIKATGGNVVSGNFYAAQPFGVIEGVDYRYTGIMRRVEVDKIRQVHASNDIVLLTSLGFSPSGEVFNVNSESLAAGVASALNAKKIIYFTPVGVTFKNKETGKAIQSLRLSDAKNLLRLHGVSIHRRGYASIQKSNYLPKAAVEALLKVGWSTSALEKGVKRAHIIIPNNGSLLQELYTRDGAGTLISRDLYEGIRRANVEDVAQIHDLIQPLVDQGTLIERPKSTLEKEIMSYYVYTRDSAIIACGQLKRYEGGFAEIGCLVVSKEYRGGGRGDAMLGFLERLCVQSGISNVFVLSTQTMDWFMERGFEQVKVNSLPLSRRETYNYARRSKIYMKQIDDRMLDADELYWDR